MASPTYLLVLPRELGDMIYDLLLNSDYTPINLLSPEPGITRTCRQLRDEMLAIHYAGKEFYVILNYRAFPEVLLSLRARPKHMLDLAASILVCGNDNIFLIANWKGLLCRSLVDAGFESQQRVTFEMQACRPGGRPAPGDYRSRSLRERVSRGSCSVVSEGARMIGGRSGRWWNGD